MWNPYHKLPDARSFSVISVCSVLALWATVSFLGIVAPVMLPSPLDVARAFSHLAWDGHTSPLALAAGYSISRVAIAGVITMTLGIPLGILMGAAPRVNAMLSPLIDPFRSAPVVAILPILVMWLGIGETMKVAFLVLGSFVFLVPMVRDAILAVPQQYWVSARDLGATDLEAVLKAVVPMAKPRIADAIIVSTSVSWTYITVAEYVNAEKGLGQLIQNARRFSAMDQVFVGIGVITAMAFVTHVIMSTLKTRLYPWETEI